VINRILGITLLLLFPVTANADLVVSTDAPSGSPLELIQGLSGVGTITVSLASTPSDTDIDSFTTVLAIVPVGGATGTVTFAGASAAATDYVFDSFPTFGFTTSGSILATDTISSAAFVTVGAAGFNLMDLTFDLSVDASGLFDIQIVAPAVGASTQFALNGATIAFSPGDGVTIGQISAVPEPGAFLFGTVVLGLIGGTSLRKRNRAEVVEG